MTSTVWLVPHTRWDREWYEPFERFRFRLVTSWSTVARVWSPSPTSAFNLDGQIAAVDDYFEVRPGRTADVARSSPAAGWLLGRGGSSWTSSSAPARR